MKLKVTKDHSMIDRVNHALFCDMTELTVHECHWKSFDEVGYYLGEPLEGYTVCIWRITLKPKGGAYAD